MIVAFKLSSNDHPTITVNVSRLLNIYIYNISREKKRVVNDKRDQYLIENAQPCDYLDTFVGHEKSHSDVKAPEWNPKSKTSTCCHSAF